VYTGTHNPRHIALLYTQFELTCLGSVAGFLPDLPINRRYAAIQWQRYKAGLAPVDFSPMDEDGVSLPYPEKPDHYTLSALGEMLMGKHLPPVQLPETAEQRQQRVQNTLWWSAALAAAGSLLYWWTKRRN